MSYALYIVSGTEYCHWTTKKDSTMLEHFFKFVFFLPQLALKKSGVFTPQCFFTLSTQQLVIDVGDAKSNKARVPIPHI